ncbi:uncharacterized protein LOC130232736 [Danio aesculapii]|uniref:uncharacterized protein LOC130232736 n=1 Tax=Danio aesculapii TaxID=1142201 RepID=UPI0024C0A38F|nr:uncharacterized protein LOC130232736 [Danio aesculapii]
MNGWASFNETAVSIPNEGSYSSQTPSLHYQTQTQPFPMEDRQQSSSKTIALNDNTQILYITDDSAQNLQKTHIIYQSDPAVQQKPHFDGYFHPSAALNHPPPVFTHYNTHPCVIPQMSHSWPMIAPQMNANIMCDALNARHNPFCQISRPPLNFNQAFNSNVVPCMNSPTWSCPHQSVYPLPRSESEVYEEHSGHAKNSYTQKDLSEYSQIMETLGSKVNEESMVSKGSEVTTGVEEEDDDVCAQFKNGEFLTEADLDMDYINFLLSSDHNISDILTENCRNTPGCSDWIPTVVFEAQIQSAWTPQPDSSSSKTTDLRLPQDPFHASKTHACQEIMMENELLTLPEHLFADHEGQNTQAEQNDSIRESVNLESDRNSTRQQDETVDSVTQTSTKNIVNNQKLEYDGGKNMDQEKMDKDQHVINTIDGGDTNSELPIASQRQVKTNTAKTDGNTVNKVKRSRRRKHRKTTKPNERSAPENEDERTESTGKTQGRLKRSRKKRQNKPKRDEKCSSVRTREKKTWKK